MRRSGRRRPVDRPGGLIEHSTSMIQAQAILDMQLRRLAALEHSASSSTTWPKIEAESPIGRHPGKARAAAWDRHDELAEIVDRHGDDRRTRIIAAGGTSATRLIAREDVVVTITETGYASAPRPICIAARNAAAGRAGAGLAQGRHRRALLRVLHPRFDPVLHHPGTGLRARPTTCPRPPGRRAGSGQPVSLPAEERIAQVIQIRGTTDAPYLVLALTNGLVKSPS